MSKRGSADALCGIRMHIVLNQQPLVTEICIGSEARVSSESVMGDMRIHSPISQSVYATLPGL